jgi:hypothetical protein
MNKDRAAIDANEKESDKIKDKIEQNNNIIDQIELSEKVIELSEYDKIEFARKMSRSMSKPGSLESARYLRNQ